MNYYLCEKAARGFDAGVKARDDIKRILGDMDQWRPVEVHRCWDRSGKMERLRAVAVNCGDWAAVSRVVGSGDVLLVQYPLAMYPKVSLTALPFLDSIRRKGCRIILLVHDLDSLRGRGSSLNDDRFLERADVIIAHNGRMKKELARRGVRAEVCCLGVFDYLAEGELPPCDEGVDVAGNLGREKAGYIYLAAERGLRLPLNLYGANYDGPENGVCRYRGRFAPEELPKHMTGRFGLVWDGDSLECCSGEYGAYLAINSPHKLSLYLALGKPVMIWSGAAEADFVAENGVGIVINSIREGEACYLSLSGREYERMRDSAAKMSERLRKGFYTRRAIGEALRLLGRNG